MSAPHRPPPTPGPPASGPQPALPPWRPLAWRQRLRLLALTVVTVAGLAYVLQRPHQQRVAEKAERHAAACRATPASRPADCPGADMPVRLLPAAPGAAASVR